MAWASAIAMGPALGAVAACLHAVRANSSVARTVAFMLSDRHVGAARGDEVLRRACSTEQARAELRLLMAGTSARAIGPALGAVAAPVHAVRAKTNVARVAAGGVSVSIGNGHREATSVLLVLYFSD